MIFHLSFQLQSHAKFVSSLVEVLEVNQRRQGNSDACKNFTMVNNYFVLPIKVLRTLAQLLLVTETKLRSVVDLGTDGTFIIQLILAAKTESGGVRSSSPCELNTSFKVGVDLLEQGSSKLLTVITVKNVYLLEENKNPNIS